MTKSGWLVFRLGEILLKRRANYLRWRKRGTRNGYASIGKVLVDDVPLCGGGAPSDDETFQVHKPFWLWKQMYLSKDNSPWLFNFWPNLSTFSNFFLFSLFYLRVLTFSLDFHFHTFLLSFLLFFLFYFIILHTWSIISWFVCLRLSCLYYYLLFGFSPTFQKHQRIFYLYITSVSSLLVF